MKKLAAELPQIDLGLLDRDALVQLRKEVDRALQRYDRRKRDDALREIQAVAERHGVTFKDVFQSGTVRSITAPRFRHPEDTALTWSGRGRQPAWYKGAVAAGTEPEELLIS